MNASTAARTDAEPPSLHAARCAAYLLDLLCGLALAVAFALLGWLWLLARTAGGTLPPADSTVYIAIAIWLLWLPLWTAIVVLGWSSTGQTLGLAALALRVVAADGGPPAMPAALGRCLLVIVCSALLIVGVLLVLFAGSAAAVGTIPAWLAVLASLPLLLGLCDPALWLWRRDGRALHDLITGTRVVRRP